jgi:hypothetical protein
MQSLHLVGNPSICFSFRPARHLLLLVSKYGTTCMVSFGNLFWFLSHYAARTRSITPLGWDAVPSQLPRQLLLVPIYKMFTHGFERSVLFKDTQKQNVTWPRFKSRFSNSKVQLFACPRITTVLPSTKCDVLCLYTTVLPSTKYDVLCLCLFYLFNEFIKVGAACISMHIMAAHCLYTTVLPGTKCDVLPSTKYDVLCLYTTSP